jgi:putative acetyltransferase
MPILIREIRPEDARAFLEVHHAAVRGLASKDYSSEVIETWAPMPITPQHVEGVQSNLEGEYRLVAEIDGRLVGISSIVAQKNEPRACYVIPSGSHSIERVGTRKSERVWAWSLMPRGGLGLMRVVWLAAEG